MITLKHESAGTNCTIGIRNRVSIINNQNEKLLHVNKKKNRKHVNITISHKKFAFTLPLSSTYCSDRSFG